jgi:Na+-transporting methylmalonyl-CoA/oxaloacetate decarboxylase gamma subunit|tara:strand:+ start:2142 stop:2378 length:237 start_codon:yes stop_codon:yes gene_type:complete
MTEQDILMQEGISLLYNGMVVVFSFLLLLIISVNVLRIIFATSIQENNLKSNNAGSSNAVEEDTHHKIIKEVLGGIRS